MSVELSEPPVQALSESRSEMVSIRVELLGDAQATEGAWTGLFERDENASAWQHPRSVRAEISHLTESRLESELVRCAQGEDLVGAAILLPKSIRTNQAGGIGLGWKLNGYRLVGGRFLNEDHSPQVDDALWAATLKVVGTRQADFLLIEDLDRQSPLAVQIQRSLPAGWSLFVPNGHQARLRIQFPDEGPGYWEQFSKKTLSTFRRKLKKFGDTRLERITRAEQVAKFLTQAHEISRQTWQTRTLGLRIRNSEAERASLSALADAGLLRSYVWYSNDEPAAFCVGNQAHGVFNYEEVGYATKFARFSPGQMLVVQMIEDLLAHDRPQWFDFGGGDAEYKRMFANHTSESGTVWVTPPAWKARGSLAWIQTCRALKRTARQTINSLGLATRVRQWIRYGGQSAVLQGAAGAPLNEKQEEEASS